MHFLEKFTPHNHKYVNDSALELKILYENKSIKDYKDAKPFLDNSELVQGLTSDFDFSNLNCINRIIQLAEIPFASELSFTQKIIAWIDKNLVIDEGYSWTGKRDDVLSCYMAMLTSAYIKLNRVETREVKNGIDWILKYQHFSRGLTCEWDGKGLKKYGGCMKSVPCYIGVVKACIALALFKENTRNNEIPANLESRLEEGIEYILAHNIYQRLSDGSSITKDISKLFYPYNYKTNILEILQLMNLCNRSNDQSCLYAKDLIKAAVKKDGRYYQPSMYNYKSWIQFDKKGEPAAWLEYIIQQTLNPN